jgi:2-polyprenyl-3-methyl-5-hydroxy-6-metoxy-1,4-benzoquinol methylase
MTTQLDADATVKAKHRAMWALGDYPKLAVDVVAELGPTLVAAAGVRRGDRVLDIAAGAGNAAIPAALAGAQVTAGDLTAELLDVGRAAADRRCAAAMDAGRRRGPAIRRCAVRRVPVLRRHHVRTAPPSRCR